MPWKDFRRGAIAGLIFALVGQLIIWLGGEMNDAPGIGALFVVAITVVGGGLAAAAISVAFANSRGSARSPI